LALKPQEKDYKILGLEENATEDEVSKAYERMKALYSQSSLATYSLLSDKERNEMLDRIEKAYLRLSRELSRREPLTLFGPQSGDTAHEPAGDEIPENGLGNYLKRRREDLDLPLKVIATRTRIRRTHLESIEEERLQDLPAPVYLRGFLIEFAKALGVKDPKELALRYLALYKENGEKK